MVLLAVAVTLAMPTLGVSSVVWVLAQVSDTGGIPGVAQTGVVGALLGFMWWTERGDRKAAEERERCVIRDAAERLSAGFATLKEVTDLVRTMK